MQPTLAMITVAHKLARFIAGNALVLPPDLFTRDAVIVENFAPYIFRDITLWETKMREHLAGISSLQYDFGAPVDFMLDRDTAYFALPTRWAGLNHTTPFEELGGWSLVLKLVNGDWRLAGYGWAVIETTVPQ